MPTASAESLRTEMGLGKTIQVIALCWMKRQRTAHVSRGVSGIPGIQLGERVCPVAPELKIMTAAGNQAEREEMFAAYEEGAPGC